MTAPPEQRKKLKKALKTYLDASFELLSAIVSDLDLSQFSPLERLLVIAKITGMSPSFSGILYALATELWPDNYNQPVDQAVANLLAFDQTLEKKAPNSQPPL